jgi:hypothetical protein
VTDSSLAGASSAFAEILAARASADREIRRKAIVRTVSGILVFALHVLFLVGLVIAISLQPPRRAGQPAEVELVLAPLNRPAAMPQVIEARPKEKKKEIELFEPRPINIPPPPVEVQPKQPVDIMRALGAELACGASHYEYLNTVERKLCHRAPWKMPERAFAAVPATPTLAGHLTGAEAVARERAQAPPCPPNINTPCIDEVIYGKGPH